MKTRNLIVLSIMALIIGISSCRDDFDFDLASDNLSFSQDTLNLDTIFNHTNSQTYKLTIHNRQNEDVQIPKIYLSRGNASFFKMNVDGMPGSEFENVAIRKKDSIFIFVEIAAGDAPVNPFYEDEINFETTNGIQQVKLLSYIEKAKFYNTEQSENYTLPPSESNWNNEFSRVIFGNVNADNLTIGPRTKVYFHHNASLTVNNSLNVQGTLQNEVIFRTDRMDERSDSLPNTWNKIHLAQNSISIIDYAIIKGANVGLDVDNSTLTIKNSKILNNERIGLYAHGASSNVIGKNLVINNSDLAALAIEGGTHEFKHSTFSNYFNIGQGAGGNYSLYLGNVGENNSSIPLNQANFFNCIFYGRASNAIIFEENESQLFNHLFKNNVIRLDFPDEVIGIDSSNTLNKDPLFVNSGFGTNDLRISEGSEVIGTANSSYLDPDTFRDIRDITRPADNTLNPGAYQQVYISEP